MKYSDLEVWQEAMAIAESVFRLCASLPASQRFVLSQQMQRSALSIPCNIAEGHGRKSTGAFLNHLSIASGSLRELETQLRLAQRLGLIAAVDVVALDDRLDKVGRMLAKLSSALRSADAKRDGGDR
jgi:four helix bundle protein